MQDLDQQSTPTVADQREPILRVRDLHVSFGGRGSRVAAVRGVDLDLYPGEVLGIVGESGSGKSVTANAIMGLHGRSAQVEGSIALYGEDLLRASDSRLNKIRGSKIAMVFQDPMTSLNPVRKVGDQVIEAIRIHRSVSREQARTEAVELLRVTGIPRPEVRMNSYPHEFSGGMRQRVVIAIAMANNPDVIIADEPTTALDVTVQMQVLDALEEARRHVNAALILVTHDLGVIAGHADRLVVMYGGRVVESGPAPELFTRSRMPYTRGLLAATPRIDRRRARLVPVPGAPPSPSLLTGQSCPFAPRCTFATEKCTEAEPALLPVATGHESACHYALDDQHLPAHQPPEEVAPDVRRGPNIGSPPRLVVRDLVQRYTVRAAQTAHRTVFAVNGVSFEILPGETLGLVGESGCGKSSVSRSVVRLQEMTAGEVELDGAPLSELRGRALKGQRRNIQMVFQDPFSSLDPRYSVRQLIGEALRLSGVPRRDHQDRVAQLLTDVGLSPGMADRYPHEFSGGQRQRLGIARALATNPRVMVLDEPVSALDVSVQAGVVNLLRDLQDQRGLSYLFIAHDLSVVANIADRIAVMHLGKIIEIGPTDEIFENPQHPYTRALISAIPIPDPAVERRRSVVRLRGDVPSPLEVIEGCNFQSRCPIFVALPEESRALCSTKHPNLDEATPGHRRACHFPDHMPERHTNEGATS